MAFNDELSRFARLPLVLFVGLMLAAIVSGGSNRGDVMIVMIVRLAAVLCLGAAILFMPRDRLQAVKIPLLLLAGLAGWMAIQLAPLPPAVWTALPGRERLAAAFTAAEMPVPWMPISILATRTLGSLLALLPPAAMLVLVAWLPRRSWPIQASTLLAVGIMSGLLGLVQISSPIDSHWYIYDTNQKGGAVGLFANRNHQAAFLNCMFPLLAAVTVFAMRKEKRGRTVTLLCLLVALFLLPLIFIAGSRAGLALTPIALTSTLFLAWPLVRWVQLARRWRLVVAGGAVVLFVALGAILLSARSLSLQRLWATNVTEEQRVLVVDPILQLIRHNLPTGTGFGTFDPAFRAIQPYSLLHRTYLNHAHSDPLELLSDGGLPAGLILLTFMLWWGRAAFLIWFRVQAGEAARAATIATAVLMLASLVDYPLRAPLAATVFAVFVAWMAKALANDPVTAPQQVSGVRVHAHQAEHAPANARFGRT